MCRFLAYLGAPIVMDKLLFQPENSLIHQSFQSREREEPLNGDGFGLGWYVPEINPLPAVFSSIQPAWNNRNLRYLAPKVQSGCIFAHVRAASMGDVSELNCHPFTYGHYLFMHNGSVGGFRIIKRILRRRLSDAIYDWLQGDTDSVHFFAMFLEHLQQRTMGRSARPDDFVQSLLETISEIRLLQEEHGLSEPSFLNFAFTDGQIVVATRYTTDEGDPDTLYYSEGRIMETDGAEFRMREGDPTEHAVLVVSEKLTDEKKDWHLVPKNHMVLVHRDLSVDVTPVEV